MIGITEDGRVARPINNQNKTSALSIELTAILDSVDHYQSVGRPISALKCSGPIDVDRPDGELVGGAEVSVKSAKIIERVTGLLFRWWF